MSRRRVNLEDGSFATVLRAPSAKAAAGNGKGGPPPDDAAKVKLRQQSLDWLRAEYKAWDQFESGAPSSPSTG